MIHCEVKNGHKPTNYKLEPLITKQRSRTAPILKTYMHSDACMKLPCEKFPLIVEERVAVRKHLFVPVTLPTPGTKCGKKSIADKRAQ